MTKRENMLLWIVAGAVFLYFGWPHVRTGWAYAKSVFNKQRSFVVTGTADSGADATVLTGAAS
jgi:hypothetical protein